MYLHQWAALSLLLATSAFAWETKFEESFNGDWQDRWELKGSVGPTDEGRLISDGRELYATLKQTVKAPAVRISYDAIMTTRPGVDVPSDLSLFLGNLFFQFGGDSNAVNTVKSNSDAVVGIIESSKFYPIKLNRTHKIVIEINGRTASLSVDGRTLATALLKKPFESGPLKFYSWSGVASFDNLKIQTRSATDPPSEGLIAALEKKKAEEAERARNRAMPHLVAGELRASATIYSVGIEWDIQGDGNHNAACKLRYRKQGEAWRDALAPLRIDYRGGYDFGRRKAYRHFNMFAGSLMFLQPGTTYDLQLSLTDPDGGEASQTVTVTTRTQPSLAAPQRRLHVVPGDGGGVGTQDNPLRGLAAADAVARPGDLFLLHAGRYERVTLQRGGSDTQYVAYKPAGDGDAVIVGNLGIMASSLWFEGLNFVTIKEDSAEMGGIRGKQMGLANIVVVRNRFINTRYGVSNTEREWNGDPDMLNRFWYIADNVYEGGPVCEYFTRLFMLADGDICYNRVTTTLNGKGGDGIATRFCTNLDIYHNDLQQISDDHFEPDAAYANIRIWRNRARVSKYETVSFQPQNCGPWYIVQNEIAQFHPQRYGKLFKTNVYDRNVIIGNTFVVRGRYCNVRADIMLGSYSRNNLWVLVYDNPSQKTNAGGAVWSGGSYTQGPYRYLIPGQLKADWKTDVDHEGFAWEDVPDMRYPLWWGGKRYSTPAELAQAIGLGPNMVRVYNEALFTVDDLVTYAHANYPESRLTLTPDSAAIDAGTTVPGIIERYAGKAPDLGAYELGAAKRHYGPRN